MAITSITTPNTLSAVRNHIVVEALADSLWATYGRYEIKIVVEWEDGLFSTNWETIDAEISAIPDENNRVLFNLSRLLRQHVELEKPNFSTAAAYNLSSLCRRFRYTLEEWIDGAKNSEIVSTTYYMNQAGFGHVLGQNMDQWVSNGKFLTHQPRTKRVSAFQPELLYFQVPSAAAGTQSITVDITHTNGSQTTGVNPGISSGASSFDVVVFPVGYQALGLDAYADVASWEVYLSSNISERMKYELDCHCSPMDRFYYFANSLGGWDCLRTTGELSVQSSVQGKNVEKILSPFYLPSDHQFEDFDLQQRDEMTQYSGHLTREESLWLKDFLRSPRGYRVGDILPNMEAEGDLVPIIMDRGKTKILEDNEFLYGLKLKYKDGFKNQGL